MGGGPMIELTRGRLSLAWPDAELLSIVGYCRLDPTEVFSGQAWAPAGEVGTTTAAVETDCGPVTLRMELACAGDVVDVQLSATASRTCAVVEIGLRTEPRLSGATPQWMLYSGYQSWDPAGHIRLGENGRSTESWWTCGLAGGPGQALGLSAVTAQTVATRFACTGRELTVTQSAAICGVGTGVMWKAAAGDAWQGEAIVLAPAGDPYRAIANLVAARSQQGPADAPSGWVSWYHYGPWISKEDVLENSAALASGELRGLGYDVILIDDGWQMAYGDWSPNSKFGPRLADLVEQLSRDGLATGLWSAPFLVSASADVAQAPEDWFVRDDNGDRMVDPNHIVFGPMYVLNANQPPVRRHLEDTFGQLYRDGIRLFKLDFLYAGGYAGLAGLRAGLQAIRAATKDSYLLASGAPLLPVVGLVDGCRIVQDTASPIFNFEAGAPEPTIFGDEVTWVSRNVSARHFLRPWFQLDPDVALTGGNLTLEQGRQLVTVAVLAGGPFFASDHLLKLAPERRALLTNPRVIGLAGGGTALPDWEPSTRDLPASVWRRADGVLAVFNWSSQERDVEVKLPGRWHVLDLWGSMELGPIRDALKVRLPGPGSGLYQLRSA